MRGADTQTIGNPPQTGAIEASSGTREETGEAARQKTATAWLARNGRVCNQYTIAASACGIANGFLIIFQCTILALVVHRVAIERATLETLLPWLGAFCLVAAGRALAVYGWEVFGFRAARTVEKHVRAALMRAIVAQGPAFLQGRDSGAVASTALEQIGALEGYYARYAPQSVVACVVPLVMIMVAFAVNWVAGLIFVLTIPLIPVFMILIGKTAATESRRQFQALSWMSGYFLDRLRGLTTLNLFDRAYGELENIEQVSDEYRHRTMRVLRRAFLSSTTIELFSMAAIALVAIYIGFGYLGYITFGPAKSATLFQGLLVLLLAPEIFQPVRQFALFYHDRAAAIGAAEDIVPILKADESRKARATARVETPDFGGRPPRVRFRDVGLSFPDGRRALDRVSFDVRPGECVALVGPSGAGKSSVVNLLLGFAAPTSGEVRIGDYDPAHLGTQTLNRLSAWVSQRPYIFHGSIAENILLADPSADADRLKAAAEAAYVLEFANELPDGLNTKIGERGFGLSGGQLQRLALARAFLKDAPLVFLDEPTAHLDRDAARTVISTIGWLRSGRTVILCTHDEELARLADRSLIMDRGRILTGGDG